MTRLVPIVLALTGLVAYQATHIHTSGTLPSTCIVGDIYIKTGSGVGLYSCNATNTWTGPITGSGSGDVVGPAGSVTDEALPRFDGTTGELLQGSLITLSDVGAFTFPDGVKQTFNPDGTNAGFNVGSQAGDPSTPSNGDCWYDSTANEFTCRINGSNVALGAGGGSVGDLVDFQFARKTATTSATSDTVLDDDPHLTVAVGASQTWVVEFDLAVANTGVTGDIKVTVSVPASPSSCNQQMTGLITTATAPSGDVVVFSTADCTDTGIGSFGTDDAFGTHVRMVVTLVNGSNSGNVTLRWAQNASNGTATTLSINSIVRAYRVQAP